MRLGKRSGQAVLMVLLLLFVLVVISAAFVALLSRNIAGAGRQREVVSAQGLVEAGMDYADKMLTTSPFGADWRPPDPRNDPSYNRDQYYDQYELNWGLEGFTKYPNPLEVPPTPGGEGYYLLKVEYAPTGGFDSLGNPINDPLSKYIKITSVGHSMREPTVMRRLVAYKPIGITEYIRFVTNADRSGRDNDWGIPPWIDYNNNKQNDEQSPPYPGTSPPTPGNIYNPDDRTAITDLYGPVRFQGDVFFRGANRFFLTPVPPMPAAGLPKFRNDKIEVTGDPADDTHWYSHVENHMGTIVDMYAQEGGTQDWIQVHTIANTPHVNSAAFSYLDKEGDVVLRRKIRRIEPPDIFTKNPATGVMRYEALTRWSGSWIPGTSHNTGEFGYGAGIYIDNAHPDNSGDIQFPSLLGHDLEKLRDNMLRPGTALAPGQYWTWTASAAYNPPGVVIQLKPGKLSGGSYPTWPDPDAPRILFTRSDGQQFKAEDGVTDIGTVLDAPYPENGVVYCTGNVRVYGTLPQRETTDNARYFDVTVVSGATIYIDASLLTPQDLSPSLPPANRSYIGLLAKDMVVLNPTLSGKLGGGDSQVVLNGDVSLEANATGSDKTHYEIRPGGSLVLRFQVASPMTAPVYFKLTHCGADPGPTVMNMLINGQYFDFDAGTAGVQSQYTFASSPTVAPDDPTRSNHLSPDFETRSWEISSYLNLNAGDVNNITLQLDPSSSTSYWLGNFALESKILVRALAYAQNGSWFVIPGNYYGNPDALSGDAAIQNLRYNTPIIFWGAIAESHPADSPAVADWVKKWSYPYYDVPGDYLQKKDLSPWNTMNPHWGTVEYHYDDDLINNRRGGLPILPALPVSPDLVYQGEE